MEEYAVIALAQSGDPAAFQRLYELHHTHVVNRCRKMLRNQDDAEDVAQEVFLLLWRNIKYFRHQCAFSTWLFRLTTNKVISHLRSRKTRPQAADCEIPEVSQIPDQHQRLEILEALGDLTEMERLCIEAEMAGNTLRYHGGANYLRSAAKELREVLV